MGLSPEAFYRITPAEFIYAWLGWSELERSRGQQAWERERWAVWILTTIQLDRKDRLPMTQMFPLPWEQVEAPAGKMTMDERRERVKKLLNKHEDEI